MLGFERSLLVSSLITLTCGAAWAQGPTGAGAESPAVQYLNTRLSVKYVGDRACLPCHEDKFKTYKQTGMGRSMSIPAAADRLGEFTHPAELRGEESGKSYSVLVQGGKLLERETQHTADGKTVFSDTRRLAYAVGSGEHGRTYLIAQGDSLFLAPLTYYSTSRKWDFSPGHEAGQYPDFDRPATEQCLYCHSNLPQFVAGTRNQFKRPPIIGLTIGCERCHGPGDLHVQQRVRGDALEGPLDRSIVNPAKLSNPRRDDVCAQCHLGGDAHVLRAGKSYEDFRPGTQLDDVLAIYSVPPSVKVGTFKALGHVEQMRLSRCWVATQGTLGCITCHDPHEEPRGIQAVTYFKRKCLSCHRPADCKENLKLRLSISPPDNCLTCHMPKRAVSEVSHAALTDHRIPRIADLPMTESKSEENASSNPEGLVHESLVPGQKEERMGLRTLALAYAQVAAVYPDYREEGFRLLAQAAHEFPDDPEVQQEFGSVLLQARSSPSGQQLAAQAFERALALNSKSIVARTQLAELKARGGDFSAAARLLQDAIRLDPYYPPAFLDLAQVYLLMNDRKQALDAVNQVLAFDPENQQARKALKKVVTIESEP